ncbi:MAG: bifunctional folylpolyglutamate synthase/dihydrofolate synthase [SAR86 cluster bacterium]|nr:bifunctional folylpolyglutamate synthase/dihydrofolate synthase [SAR86 cluster bacterium]
MPKRSLEHWLSYIEKLNPEEIELGLDRIRPVYEKLINSPLAKKIILVGGTNGKGSTVEYLSELLRDKNKRVGTYTSPHLFSFNERIRINGKECSDSSILNSFMTVERARESIPLTYFEFSTLAAIQIFSESELDVVILEVGLGGRLDAVNVVEPDISILTNVELDHQDWLGNNREVIGKEKADIFREGKPAVLAQKNLPKSVFQEAIRKEAVLYTLNTDFGYEIDEIADNWSYFFSKDDKNLTISKINLTNLSVESASAALTTFILLGEEFNEDLKKVIEKTNLKGRCELIKNKFLLDVSHNPAAVQNLKHFIRRNFKTRNRIVAVFGVMSDKDVLGMVEPIKKIVSRWYVTSPEIGRAMKTSKLTSLLRESTDSEIIEVDRVKDAVHRAFKDSSEETLILVLGSFYTVSEAVPVIEVIVNCN